MINLKNLKLINKVSYLITFILIIIGIGFKEFIPKVFYKEFGILLLIFIIVDLVTYIILWKKKK